MTTVTIIVDIVLCLALLFVLWRVGRGLNPAAPATGSSSKTVSRSSVKTSGALKGVLRSSVTRKRGSDANDQSPDCYKEVISLAAQGLPRDAIARKLGITAGEINLVLDLDQSKHDER